MEGKAKSHDLNSSLKTKYSNEVWFRVILEGREDSISGTDGMISPKATRPGMCTPSQKAE